MLLDTSGLACLHNESEPFHAEAVGFFAAARFRVTHSYVLAEYLPLALSRRLSRATALAFLARAGTDPEVAVVWVDQELHRRGVELLVARPDKGYSLCDAVSFVLMRDYRQTDALTTDKHFEQEGFRRLLA